ncbi:MAG TPA: transglutaminase-like cysteine peptidase [Microvirga sp.]|nr:transglutaminase-like cysteine peptidase [Microvirga sp.]
MRTVLFVVAGMVAPAQASPTMINTADAPPLAAWSDLCRASPAECAFDRAQPETVAGTPETLELIRAVNGYVNRTVSPITDPEYRGVADRWEYPTEGLGDCEDYQLLKRKLLIEAGLPKRALLMTVVINRQGEGHAVLTVRTDREDLVLDNQTNEVLRWDRTGYEFIKREALTRTGWAYVQPGPEAAVVTAAAGK